MVKYIVKRVLLMIPTLLSVAVLVFFLMRIVPGDIVELRFAGESAFSQKENLDKERARLGLDQPLWKQFVKWMGGLLLFDFGTSMWTGAPISEEIRLRFALSLQLAIMATIVAVVLAIPLGVVAALKQDTWVDYVVRIFSIAGLATPSFWLGIMFILALLIIFKWLPPMVYTPFWVNPWQNLAQLIWPALAVGYRYSAVATRMTRSAMLEVLREDYIRTARAKGLVQKLILSRHALKNAMLPVLTVVAIEFAFLIGGLGVTEQGVNLNGIGLLFVQAVALRDYTLLPALVMLGAGIARALARHRRLRPRRALASDLRLAHRASGRLRRLRPRRHAGVRARRRQRVLRRPRRPLPATGDGHLPVVPADHPGAGAGGDPRQHDPQPHPGHHGADDPPGGAGHPRLGAGHSRDALCRRRPRGRLPARPDHSAPHAPQRHGPLPDHADRVSRA